MIGETPADLIEIVDGAGSEVTRDQLVRWHREGLIPRPAVEHLGRGRGSVSYYPPGTAAQVLALLDIQKSHRRLADVAWLLWWAGYPVDEGAVRARLAKLVDTWTTGFEAFATGELLETALAPLSDARLPSQALRWTRQRLGRDDFVPWLRGLVEGLRNGDENADEADLQRLGAILDSEEPANTQSVAETLAVISKVLHPSALQEASKSSLTELAGARDKIKQFLFIVGTFGEISLKTQGRWTPRVGAFSVFLGEAAANPDGQALILLAWQAMQTAGLADGAAGIFALSDKAERSRREWAAISEIRAMLPPDEAYLVRPKRLGKAQTDPKEHERLRADLLRIRERWEAEIDAILEAHEVRAELASAPRPASPDAATEQAGGSERGDDSG